MSMNPLESDTQDPVMDGQPQRERQPTTKALNNNIDMKERDLQVQWRKTSQHIKNLCDAPDDQTIIQLGLSETRLALQSYSEAWTELEQLKTNQENSKKMQ